MRGNVGPLLPASPTHLQAMPRSAPQRSALWRAFRCGSGAAAPAAAAPAAAQCPAFCPLPLQPHLPAAWRSCLGFYHNAPRAATDEGRAACPETPRFASAHTPAPQARQAEEEAKIAARAEAAMKLEHFYAERKVGQALGAEPWRR